MMALMVLGLMAGCNEPKVSVELEGQPVAPRYQIVINTHKRDGTSTEAFLLDAQEGRVWEYVPFIVGSNTSSHFRPMDILDEQGKLGLPPLEWIEREERVNALQKAKESK